MPLPLASPSTENSVIVARTVNHAGKRSYHTFHDCPRLLRSRSWRPLSFNHATIYLRCQPCPVCPKAEAKAQREATA